MNFKKGPIVDFGLPSSPNSKVQTSKQNKKSVIQTKQKNVYLANSLVCWVLRAEFWVLSVECLVLSVECGVWSEECGVWSVECRVLSVECRV